MDAITYSDSADGVAPGELAPFFVGWSDPPDDDRRRRILAAADEVVIARDGDGSLVGFATAITDGAFAGYIPLVEVVPSHRRRGIGARMVGILLARLGACYMIDLVCDAEVFPFYERLGGTRVVGVAWRNYERLLAAGQGGGEEAR